jgi:uncharacterized DUF497 family protein
VFEWDAQKAAANEEKHGVSFEEGSTAFFDPLGLDGEDLEHSMHEARRLRLAKSAAGRVLVLAYTWRQHGDEETRIISTRPASRKEKKRYARED